MPVAVGHGTRSVPRGMVPSDRVPGSSRWRLWSCCDRHPKEGEEDRTGNEPEQGKKKWSKREMGHAALNLRQGRRECAVDVIVQVPTSDRHAHATPTRPSIRIRIREAEARDCTVGQSWHRTRLHERVQDRRAEPTTRAMAMQNQAYNTATRLSEARRTRRVHHPVGVGQERGSSNLNRDRDA